LGLDFRGELYPEAQYVLRWANPFPPADVALTGVDRIYPIPAAFLVAPLTALPPAVATAFWSCLSVLLLAATLRLLGVIDWRVYGLVALWPPTLAEFQTGNLTVLLVFLVAVAWRLRVRRIAPGIAVGIAIALKLFIWPLGLWLVARRRFASAATAAAIAAAGTLLVLPFESYPNYLHLVGRMATRYGPGSYSPVGLLSQAGVADRTLVELIAWAFGLGVLALAYRRRSLSLTLAASLLLSPIVWLHYFLLLIVPLALRWPRLSLPWFIPLGFWACVGQGAHLHDIVAGLLVFAAVIVVSESNQRLSRAGSRRNLHFLGSEYASTTRR
jgi:hypothetical protein